MKRQFYKSYKIGLILLMLCAFNVAYAQFRFGVKGGVNINRLHLENFKSNLQADNGCGFTGGVMTEFTVPVIGICMDASLMYTHMAGQSDITLIDDDNFPPEDKLKTSKNFFEIPVNLKYKLGLPIISPYIFTGPSFAFKLGGKDDIFKTKTFQCAWNVGLGLELLKHLQLSASYGFGMNNVFKQLNIVEQTADYKVKNNYWTISAAYLF